jgi:putative ATP-dependent endonuclease of the OLD family
VRISRVVIKNFRSFDNLDVVLSAGTTCVIGENNTGKTNFLHAIRLCIDAGLTPTYRALISSDIHSSVDISYPCQVLIALEITDFTGVTNEEALVGAWQSQPGLARLIYRFRPKLGVREDLTDGEIEPGTLTLQDYQWEITGGGDPDRDLAEIDWDEDAGSSIRFSDLQSFLVVFLPALRDVQSDLQQFRASPLARLIDAMEIDNDDKQALVEILRDANKNIAESSSIEEIAEAIDASFKKVAGPAFSMDVALGVAEPSFQAIIRTLRILLSNLAMSSFEVRSNGLGLNNILYVAILIEYFHKRMDQKKSAGQLILFEEPEAHLHPQLQISLYTALSTMPFQSILTTHSTHITAHADLASYVVLTQGGADGIYACVPSQDTGLENEEILDLERYLDATKSNLLFARKVMLVEGPAELFMIPALLRSVRNIDLDRAGISIIPIYGVHFDVYAKLFGKDGLPKKCAIVADGDLVPDDADPDCETEDDLAAPPDLKSLENEHVKVFTCATTFERALTRRGTLEMLACAADDISAPTVAKRLRKGAKAIADGNLKGDGLKEVLEPLRETVLNTAKRFGKARFAQIAARHADKAKSIPTYISDAVTWLMEE